MNYEALMILKNFVLMGAGFFLCLLMITLLMAYYIKNTEVTEEIEENIVFNDVRKAKLLWKHPKDFIVALEMVCVLMFWHFTNSKRETLNVNLKRGRIIFLVIVILFIVSFIFGIFGSTHIKIKDGC